MGRARKPRDRKEPQSELHALFARRVQEELKRRTLNPTSLQEYGAVQRTLWDVLNMGSDPRLSTIRRTANALGIKAADLLREGADKRVNVIPLHGEPPKMIPPSATPQADKHDRKKRRR